MFGSNGQDHKNAFQSNIMKNDNHRPECLWEHTTFLFCKYIDTGGLVLNTPYMITEYSVVLSLYLVLMCWFNEQLHQMMVLNRYVNHLIWKRSFMMTLSNGNIFSVPVTRNFDIFFDLRPNKRLSKQSWGWWFEMPPRPLWRHCNARLICKITLAQA